MKKKGIIQKITSFFLTFVMLLGVLIPMQPVFAEGLERVETKITDFTITKSTGEVPPDGFKVNDFLKLSISWDASYYQNELKEGDYFNITLPDEFRFPTNDSACNFDIIAPNGTDVVAKAVVTPGTLGGGNIKVTFTKYVEDRYDIKGSMYLNANFNTTIINTPGNHEIVIAIGSYPFTIIVPIAPSTSQNPLNNEILNKWVGQTLTNEGYVRWTIRINHRKGILNNVVITDWLTSESGDMTGIEYVADKFKLEEVEMDEYGNVGKVLSTTDISDKVVLSPDKTSFTYHMGNIENRHFILRYNSTYREGLKLKNTAKLEADGESVEKKQSFSIASSGGQGSGDLTSKIKIVKLDAEDHQIKLADAKFLITKLADNSTFTLTTNSEGEAISNKLIPGKYKIKEMQAPVGYKLNNEEYEVEVTSDGACIKEIENEPERTEIKVEKVWVGKKGDSITAVLKADGRVIDRHAITAPTWEYTFEGLRKYDIDTGEEIRYTVEEENVPEGYTANYIEVPDMEGYWIIENKLNKTEVKVTKEWEGVTGEKPAIKLQLLKNGQAEGVPVELTNGTTTHTWTELDKIDSQGNEYTYTVKEVGETGSYIQIGNDWYKVVYDGNQEDGLSVTNKKLSSWTPMEPPTRNVKVTKLWKDSSGTNLNEAPVDKIKVELYKDGVATGKKLELTKDNNWSGEFKKLEVANGLGSTNYYKYTVKEVGESGATIQLVGKWYGVSYDGTMAEGFTITNKEKTPWTPMEPPTRTIKVTKEWKNDNGNVLTAPVEKIEVELYKDGVATGKKLELTKDNNWTGEFKNLEVADGLGSTNYYKYTVKEIGEDGNTVKFDGKMYKVVYEGSMKDGFTITNKKEAPPAPPNTEKPEVPNTSTPKTLPKTGDGTNLSLYAWLMLISGVLLILIGYKRRKYAK
ncbi:LPXTG-motif cell wall anchor domain-containing protein/sortase B cell surface sorting signal [Peptostreptococcaceae bacterium pGA-8]|nr:LPXTG-motif cell wall anchor domain-containing protein/sortase B cell surface sorting signal [Peptostreptococcaceae bacterium pGA-8]